MIPTCFVFIWCRQHLFFLSHANVIPLVIRFTLRVEGWFRHFNVQSQERAEVIHARWNWKKEAFRPGGLWTLFRQKNVFTTLSKSFFVVVEYGVFPWAIDFYLIFTRKTFNDPLAFFPSSIKATYLSLWLVWDTEVDIWYGFSLNLLKMPGISASTISQILRDFSLIL